MDSAAAEPDGKRCESVTVTSTVFADEKSILPLFL